MMGSPTAQPYFASGLSNAQANQQAAQSPQQQRMVSALMNAGQGGGNYAPVQSVGQGIAQAAGQTMAPLQQQWAAQQRAAAASPNRSDYAASAASPMGRLAGIFGMGQ